MLCWAQHTLRVIYQPSAGFRRPSCSTWRAMKSQGLHPVQLPSRVWGWHKKVFRRTGGCAILPRGRPRQDEGRGQGCLPEWGAQTHGGQQGLPSTGRAAARSLCSLGSYSNTNTAVRWMDEHIGKICLKMNCLQMIACVTPDSADF